MKKIALQQIPLEERISPKGKFHIHQRNVSLALGGLKDTGPDGGGHPFDLCEVILPPGKLNWPYHYHSSQWELFVIQKGTGLVRTNDGEIHIGPGDTFLQKPGDPHQIKNTGETDLVFLVIANNPASDVVGYPDTGQWFIKPARKLLGHEEKPYYSGEE